MFFSILYVIGLPYSCQNCTYNQPVHIFLFHADFTLEDIVVNKSLKQAIAPMNPELPGTSVVGSSVHAAAGISSQLRQSSLNEPENKELSAPIAAGGFSKQQQSSLNEPANKEVSVPTTVGTESRLGKSSMHDPENNEVSVPSAASVVSRPNIIEHLKSFFGVRKEVNEIKITVTPEEFLKKSWEVGKKKLHQRKIVPVIIWDFGGQDVFYSTHQTFLTYRAIYMLVLDGSRTLDEECPFEQYLPGKGGAKTQRGSSFFYAYDV